VKNKHSQQPNEVTSDPFLEPSTDSFFFSTPALMQRLDLLRHLIRSGGFLLILTGEHGSGKSILLQQLFASADSHWKICSVPTAAHTGHQPHLTESAGKFSARLLKGYDLVPSGQDSDSLRDTLFDYIKALHSSDRIPLIVINDSKTLSLEDFQLLVELSCGNEELLSRIILVCRPEDMRRIREFIVTAGGDEFIHTVDIPPLDEEQVGDYLHLRWNQINFVGDDPFTDNVIHSIYHASKGLPANVNRLADQFLQNRRSNRNRDTQTRGNFVLGALAELATRKGILLALAGVIVAIIAFFLFIATSHQPQPGTEVRTLPVPIISSAIQEIKPSAIIGENDKSSDRTVASEPSPLPPLEVPRAFIPQETTPQNPAPSFEFDSASPPVDTDSANDSDIATIPIPIEQGPSGSVDRITLPAVTAKAHTVASQEIDPYRIDAETPSAQIGVKPNPEGKRKSVRTLERTLDHKPVRTIAWLRQQNSNHYTLQLLGTSSKEKMQEFFGEHKLGDQVAWFKTRHNNDSWFVIVYGIYPTSEAARTKIPTLPRALQRFNPWPRKIGEILTATSGG